jgi:hypothetical protein
MNLLFSEEATNFKARSIALASDIKPFIVKYILKRWQDSWDQQIHNKLDEMHSLVSKTPFSYSQNRKEQVVLTRCRILDQV